MIEHITRPQIEKLKALRPGNLYSDGEPVIRSHVTKDGHLLILTFKRSQVVVELK